MGLFLRVGARFLDVAWRKHGLVAFDYGYIGQYGKIVAGFAVDRADVGRRIHLAVQGAHGKSVGAQSVVRNLVRSRDHFVAVGAFGRLDRLGPEHDRVVPVYGPIGRHRLVRPFITTEEVLGLGVVHQVVERGAGDAVPFQIGRAHV